MALTDQAEVGRLELAGAQAPEIDRDLAGDGRPECEAEGSPSFWPRR